MPFKRVGICAGLALVMAAATAQAGTRGGLYDMNAMINEAHPFAAPSPAYQPAAVAPVPYVSPIAPPAPTFRHTPPPGPVMTTTQTTAQAAAPRTSRSFSLFGDGPDLGFFEKFYISAGGGLNLPNDQDGNATGGGAFTIESDPGFLVQGAIGTYIGQNIRLEAEAAYRQADFDQASSGGTTVTPTGDLKMATGMANLIYDFDLGAFKPFIGAGAGVAQLKSSAITIGNLAVAEKDATEFAFQVMLGLMYELNRDWSLGIDGRYVGTSDEDIDATAVTVNLRYNL